MEKLKTLIIKFDLPLRQMELPLFRGAIISSMKNADILFHNHDGDTFRYSYPLIQYKRINGKAAIICIGEGTDAIGAFFSDFRSNISIGDRKKPLVVESVKAEQTIVQIWEESFAYHLRKWIPLNQDNYATYRNLESLAEQYTMLEKILIGNILSFAKGLGIHFDKEIKVKISELESIRSASIKGIKMSTFDILFKSNVSFPDFIGLGQKVSIGFGTTVRKFDNKT